MRGSYFFSQKALSSPTYLNLEKYLQTQGLRKTWFQGLANFSEKNFAFDLKAAEQLEYKDLLAELVKHFCPQHLPLTFNIHDDNWPLILKQVQELSQDGAPKIWILKPALLNNGQHIKIFQQVPEIEAHFISSNRLGGRHVLQQYLNSPHLLKGPSEGHKYSLRLFVVLTNYGGAYLYPEGYFNVALKPYPLNDFSNLRPHLTNEHLSEDVLNVIQIPSRQIALFKPFYIQIKTILADVIEGLVQWHPKAFVCKKEPSLAIFGFDFMVDSNEKVWLLEANHGPCFPTTADHPLYSTLYDDFWQAFIKSFVGPIARKEAQEKIDYDLFEKLNDIKN